MLFLLRRKSERLVSSVIERRNQSIRRRELRTPYSNNGKTEVDSEYATTDNEEHIQEQSNQDKSYFDSESIGNQKWRSTKENCLWMVHIQKLWNHLKTYNISIN